MNLTLFRIHNNLVNDFTFLFKISRDLIREVNGARLEFCFIKE